GGPDLGAALAKQLEHCGSPPPPLLVELLPAPRWGLFVLGFATGVARTLAVLAAVALDLVRRGAVRFVGQPPAQPPQAAIARGALQAGPAEAPAASGAADAGAPAAAVAPPPAGKGGKRGGKGALVVAPSEDLLGAMAAAAVAAMLGRGSAAWVHYGAGEHHARLVGAHVENDAHAAATPDFDVLVEQLSLNNGDLGGIRFSASIDARPRGAPAPGSALCTFASMAAADSSELLAEADHAANLERVHCGLPRLGEAARHRDAPGGAAAVATPVPVVAPAPGGARPAPAGGARALTEPLVGHDVGDEFTLPVGATVPGTRALVVIDGAVASLEQLAGGVDLTRKALARSNFPCDDPRILARTSSERTLVEAAGAMSACTRGGATSLIDRASKWHRESGVRAHSSAAHEHSIPHRAVQLFVTVDGLNEKNIVGGELLLRRMTLHEEAVAENPEARLRLARWNAVQSAAQEAVDGLHLLFERDPQELSALPLREGAEAAGGCSSLHSAIHQHLFSTIASGMPDHVQSDRASLRELAGITAGYEMLACAVEPRDPTKVFVPEGQVSPVVLTDVVSFELGRSLDLGNILADADVAEYRLRHEPVRSCMNVRIKGDEDVRHTCLRSLYDCGILGFCRASNGQITPFFVKKNKAAKDSPWTAEESTSFSATPPKPEMSSAENMHGLDTPDGESPVLVATGDIQNCAYQCEVPSALSEFFSCEAVEVGPSKKWGSMSDVWGDRCLTVERPWSASLLGHYVVEGLNQRPALSVSRASYVFIRDCYWTPRPPWDSACWELLVCASLASLLSGNFGRPRPPSVLATDASRSGWGTMEAGFNRDEVGKIGGWNERWRFEEPIGNKEGRAVTKGMRLEIRGRYQHHQRHLVLIDNFGVALCFSRGRAASFGLLQLVRRLAAPSIATGSRVAPRWVPSECNPADEPPRLFEGLKEARAALYEAPTAGAEPGSLSSSRRAIDFLRGPPPAGRREAEGSAAYTHFENLFREWQRRRGRSTDDHGELEVDLLDYLDELLADNVKLTHAEKTVKSGIGALWIFGGERSAVLYVESVFAGSFRPGELLRAKVGDLVKPERLQPSKTQTFDDIVIFDHPEWLGEVLGSWAANATDERALFPLDAVRTARPFKAAADKLGAAASFYQLRH
ncbi:unnamed protein product, partial [Prorocentrum cordatum]